MGPSVEVQEHPLFFPQYFLCTFPQPVGQTPSPDWLLQLLSKEGETPLASDQVLRDKVRAMIRWGGFKPSGRSKPASEFLEKASTEGRLESINLAVDLGNAVSLWSGFPISVIDIDECSPPLRLEVVREESSYIFNPSGQELDIEGLICLSDGEGPCGSPVKDSQRTKTSPTTTRVFCIIWGERSLTGEVAAANKWFRSLCVKAGCELQECPEEIPTK